MYRMKAALAQRIGDHAATVDALSQAIEHVPDHAGHIHSGDVAATRVQLLAQVAQAQLAAGDREAAQQALHRCTPLLKVVRMKLRQEQAAVLWSSVLHLRGVIAGADDHPIVAEKLYGEALAVLDAANVENPRLRATIAADWHISRGNRGIEPGDAIDELAPLRTAAAVGAHSAGCCGGNAGRGFECSCAG